MEKGFRDRAFYSSFHRILIVEAFGVGKWKKINNGINVRRLPYAFGLAVIN